MKIKIKRHGSAYLPVMLPQGDWFDLVCPEDVHVDGPIANTLKRVRKKGEEEKSTRSVEFSSTLIDFGFAMQLPKGYEAHILPRSSTFNKYGILLVNSQGVIDWSYRGNDDTWKYGALATRETFIPAGTRIAQFRIVLSQRATIWQKIKHLFTSGKIEFVEVENFDSENRGGIGSTGV